MAVVDMFGREGQYSGFLYRGWLTELCNENAEEPSVLVKYNISNHDARLGYAVSRDMLHLSHHCSSRPSTTPSLDNRVPSISQSPISCKNKSSGVSQDRTSFFPTQNVHEEELSLNKQKERTAHKTISRPDRRRLPSKSRVATFLRHINGLRNK
jgi:hypothetical protein